MESHADLSGSEFNRTISKSSLNAQEQCLGKASVEDAGTLWREEKVDEVDSRVGYLSESLCLGNT